jgi:hypothetical protein
VNIAPINPLSHRGSVLIHVYEWLNKLKMDTINKDKCHHLLHYGKENKQLTYKFGYQDLQSVEEEKDLSVQISCIGKPHLQCSKVYTKGNQVLGSAVPKYHQQRNSHLLDCI